MSFDLGVLDLDGVPTTAEVAERYVRLCEGEDDGRAPSPRIDAFLKECLQRWPGETDEEFGSSPWASWPLETQRTPAGLVANIAWGRADEMWDAWVEMAQRHGLVLFDPQADEAILPSRFGGAMPSG